MSAPFLDCTQPVTRFEEILPRLSCIIETAHHERSRIGYFAALYRHVALAFRRAVRTKRYARPELIEQLDVVFFNRYLAALRLYASGGTPSGPWQAAFKAAESPAPTVLQHLVLGMNAHMGFDLGIALAGSAAPKLLPELRIDFNTMNEVIISLLSEILRDMAEVWPLLGLINQLEQSDEERLIGWSIREARTHAWAFAQDLAALDGNAQAAKIAAYAARVSAQQRVVRHPPFPLNLTLAAVRAGEVQSVRQTIEILLNRGPATESASLTIPPEPPKKRVVILGGGVGAMTAAMALTDPDNPAADQYEITLYQLGWRLGGKGASGRNPDHSYRIEEHGLHIWFGAYDNAFANMRKCYAELGRAPDAPLAGVTDAFKPHSLIVLQEQVNDSTLEWAGGVPANTLVPGDDNLMLPLWQLPAAALNLMSQIFANSSLAGLSPTGDDTLQPAGPLQQFFDRLGSNLATEGVGLGVVLLRRAQHLASLLGNGADAATDTLKQHPNPLVRSLGGIIDTATDVAIDLGYDASRTLIVLALDQFMDWLWRTVQATIDSNADHRHTWILLSFVAANIRGSLRDDVIRRGFDVLNDQDYRAWIGTHAYDDGGITLNSAYMLSVYDAMFAYVDGDNRTRPGERFPHNASMEAGTAIRCGVRQFLLCKGSQVYKMQAGMGDTVFAPMYEVLKRRGVRFEFFHRVTDVIAAEDGARIERIELARQATLIDQQHGYDPLIDVKGLPCWPSRPRYEQLVEGQELRDQQIDLEAYCSPWRARETPLTLRLGQDFDKVVLGISLGALPYVCSDLIAKSSAWRAMVDNVQTVCTQGFQIWLTETAYELGWTLMGRPLVGGYDIDPIDTWADMTHLVDREGWAVDQFPQNLSYFCAAMSWPKLRKTDRGPMADCAELDQQAANDQVREEATQLLDDYILPMLPNAAVVDDTGEISFRWELLVGPDADDPCDASRFATQYWRGNVQPSERYVLSLPGTTKYRLYANNPKQFSNLFLAGDWTNNGLNIGCVEAATMGGLLAASALSGFPRRSQIVGLDLLTDDDPNAP